MKRSIFAGLAALALFASPHGEAKDITWRHPLYVSADTAVPIAADVQMFAWPGGIGIPNVIAWNCTNGTCGIAWGSTASVSAGTNAYITDSSSNLKMNVVTGAAFYWQINAADKGSFNGTTFNISGAGSGGAGFTGTSGWGVTGMGGSTASQTFQCNSNNTNVGCTYTTNQADGASAIDHLFTSTTTLSTVGAKLASFKNNGSEVLSLKWDSGLVFNGTAIPAATDAGISTDAAAGNLFLNVPTGKTLKLGINAVQSLQVAPQTLTVGQSGGQTNITKNGTGALWLVDGTGAGDQVILTDTAGAAVFAVGTLGNGFNGIRGTTTVDLRIQSGGTKDLRLNAPTSQSGFLTVNDVAQGTWTSTKFQMEQPYYDPVAGNLGTDITADAGAVTTGKMFYRIKPTANSAVTINTITGGTAGQKICFLGDTTGGGASTTLTIAHITANTANTFKADGRVSLGGTMANNAKASMGCYMFGAPNGEANNQWWPIQ